MLSISSSVPVGQAGSSKDSQVCEDGFSSLNQLSLFESHVFTSLNLTKCSCIDDNNKGAKIGLSVNNSVRMGQCQAKVSVLFYLHKKASVFVVLSLVDSKCL